MVDITPYDPTSAVGKVRFTIADTTAPYHFTDAEVQAAIDSANGDTGRASVALLRAWSRFFSLQKKEQMGDYSYDPTANAKSLMAAADALATELGAETDDPQIGEAGGTCFLNF